MLDWLCSLFMMAILIRLFRNNLKFFIVFCFICNILISNWRASRKKQHMSPMWHMLFSVNTEIKKNNNKRLFYGNLLGLTHQLLKIPTFLNIIGKQNWQKSVNITIKGTHESKYNYLTGGGFRFHCIDGKTLFSYYVYYCLYTLFLITS